MFRGYKVHHYVRGILGSLCYRSYCDIFEVGAKGRNQQYVLEWNMMEYDSKPGKPKGNYTPKAALSLSFLIFVNN